MAKKQGKSQLYSDKNRPNVDKNRPNVDKKRQKKQPKTQRASRKKRGSGHTPKRQHQNSNPQGEKKRRSRTLNTKKNPPPTRRPHNYEKHRAPARAPRAGVYGGSAPDSSRETKNALHRTSCNAFHCQDYSSSSSSGG